MHRVPSNSFVVICFLLSLAVWSDFAGSGEPPAYKRMANDDLLGAEFSASVRTVIARLVTEARQTTAKGDARTEAIIREGLKDLDLPAEHKARAIVLGLAVAFDCGKDLRQSVLTKRFWTKYETNEERSARLKVWGKPTMLGRADLAQHFFAAGGLVALTTPEAAEATSILKEVTDANGGSGFSYVDLGSDLAGIVYATEMIRQENPPRVFTEDFEIKALLPDFGDLAEGIMLTELRNDFSLDSQSRFRRVVQSIKDRVLSLPIYESLLGKVEQSQSASIK